MTGLVHSGSAAGVSAVQLSKATASRYEVSNPEQLGCFMSISPSCELVHVIWPRMSKADSNDSPPRRLSAWADPNAPAANNGGVLPADPYSAFHSNDKPLPISSKLMNALICCRDRLACKRWPMMSPAGIAGSKSTKAHQTSDCSNNPEIKYNISRSPVLDENTADKVARIFAGS